MNKIKLIGISGLARSGKDTVSEYLSSKYGYYHKAFANALKESASIYFGIPIEWCYDDEKDIRKIPEYGNATVRELLQKFGTESTRNVFGEDFWINRLEREIIFNNLNVISDVRFDNEADWIRNNGGVIIHVVRPSIVEQMSHASEQGIIKRDDDMFIINDGNLNDLYKKVDILMDSVIA